MIFVVFSALLGTAWAQAECAGIQKCTDDQLTCTNVAITAMDIGQACLCSKSAIGCLGALPAACEVARNASASIQSVCSTIGCTNTCDAGALADCDSAKMLACSKAVGACMDAAKTDADRCACYDPAAACLGDLYKAKCQFSRDLFIGLADECYKHKCSATCGAVPGCDFAAVRKCGEASVACRSKATTDAALCQCVKAMRSCTAPIVSKCPLYSDLPTVLGNDCASSGCAASICPSVCQPGQSFLRKDGCNVCTCNADGKSTTCTRKRCAAECKGVTECFSQGKMCAKDIKMCLLPPCPQFKCIDAIGPQARAEENFDGDVEDDADATATTTPAGAAGLHASLAVLLAPTMFLA